MKKNPHLRKATKEDLPQLKDMVARLYLEDKGEPIPKEHIKRTFHELTSYPEKGGVFLIEQERIVIGYVILATFWANEYGGTILSIDELFLLPDFRGQGLGHQIIRSLIEERPYNCVAIYLEHTPHNTRAGHLYEKLGFKPYENHSLFLEFGD